MFTGIVEELGTVERIDDHADEGGGGDSLRITIAADTVLADATLGASIAVNGCCLTVSDLGDGVWTADVMRQTLAMTSLGTASEGDRVNLERSVTVESRLGGHIVQGHVDGVGTVVSRDPGEHWDVVEVTYPPHLGRYLVPQGSIAVDGVSLTLVDVSEDRFTVSLIPETLARTTLGRRAVGEQVNLEVDILAKHVEKLLASGATGTRP